MDGLRYGPVELFRGDCLEVMRQMPECSVDTVITDPPYELKFQSAKWDGTGVAFRRETWGEILRVAKPGAIMMTFGGTRTHHRVMCAIEDAGWKLKDCCMWLTGSGMPKSHNISKAIDRAAGAVRKVVGKRGHPTLKDRTRDLRQETNQFHGGNPITDEWDITAPATEAAALWDGWNTNLKPAWEPIIVAMRPLDGTFAENALKWGVAGFHIDGARLSSADGYCSEKGRWPANVMLDEEAAAMLDEQSGILKSGSRCVRRKPGRFVGNAGLGKPGDVQITYGDSGGASRFFYCAKASGRDRGKGNSHPTVKPSQLLEYLCKLTATPAGGVVLDPFLGSGTTAVACVRTGRKCIGIETDPSYITIAAARVKAELSS